MNLRARSALAAHLLALDASASITDVLFAPHPDPSARFGPLERAQRMGDARLHVSFLAGAVQAGSVGLFEDYVDWAGAVLAARRIDPRHLAEHLELLRNHLARDLQGERASFARRCLEAGIARIGKAPAATEDAADEGTPLRVAYIAAALAGSQVRAFEVVEQARATGWSLPEIYRELFVAAQRRLGELWASGEITVAQSHAASAITQWAITRLGAFVFDVPPHRGRVLVAGVEGELHGLPANIVADMLQIAGWDAVYIGTDVPVAGILSAVADHRPLALGVSTSMAFNLPRVVSLVEAMRARFPNVRVVLGGRALRAAPGLAAELGVEHDLTGDLAPFNA